MATKSTTKSPTRKAATTARKPAKTIPQTETPSLKQKESKIRDADKPGRLATAANKKLAAAPTTAIAADKADEKPRPATKMESVSLIDKPTAKPADGVPKVRTTILPPISKLMAKSGPIAPTPVETPPAPPVPEAE